MRLVGKMLISNILFFFLGHGFSVSPYPKFYGQKEEMFQMLPLVDIRDNYF